MQIHNVCTANYRHWKKRITSSSCQILLHAGLTVFAKVQKQRATCCCAPSAMGTAGESHQLARRAPLARPARQLPAGALAQGRAAWLHPAPQPPGTPSTHRRIRLGTGAWAEPTAVPQQPRHPFCTWRQPRCISTISALVWSDLPAL